MRVSRQGVHFMELGTATGSVVLRNQFIQGIASPSVQLDPLNATYAGYARRRTEAFYSITNSGGCAKETASGHAQLEEWFGGTAN